MNLVSVINMFTEDYFLENLFCIENAANLLNLPHQRIGKHKMILEVTLPNQPKLKFWRNKNPFNDNVTNILCEDKSMQAELYDQYKIAHPKTISIFNPSAKPQYDKYKTHPDLKQIIKYIESEFDYPIILKRNRSSLAAGVHYIKSQKILTKLLKKYFKKDRKRNNLLIVQQVIKGDEYRVIQFKGKTLLAYYKKEETSLDQRIEQGDLNPLHSGKPVKVTNQNLIHQFNEIAQKIYLDLGITFSGIDIIIDQSKKPYVLETNANPACSFYNQANGRADFTQVYLKCLQEYQNSNTHQRHHRPLQSYQSISESSQQPSHQ